MSIKVMARVWERSNAEGGALLVLLALADFSNDEGESWPSMQTLAQKSRLGRRQTQRVLRELEQSGEIKIFPNAGKNGVNVYKITVLGGVKMSRRKNVTRDTHDTPGGDVDDTRGVTPTTPNPSLEPSLEPSLREEGEEKSSPPTNKPPKFNDWDTKAAHALELRLLNVGNLDKPLTDHQREQWADEFRKLREIDGKPPELIARVITWLFEYDDFWIPTGNFCSAMKLRKKKDGVTYFKKFEIRYRQSATRGSTGRRRKGQTGSIEEEVARQMASGPGIA